MLPGDRLSLESAARGVRRRLLAAAGSRAGRFVPAEWPRSRGPTPNPRHK